MLSLSSMAHLQPESKSLILRELSQNPSNRGVAYCIIYDAKNEPVLLFSPENIHQQIPETVKNNSLFESGLIIQDFLTGDGHELIEFARPIFKDGALLGVVRLGLKTPQTSLFTIENLVLPSQIGFFILLALVFGYYWTALLFRDLDPLKGLAGAAKSMGSRTDILDSIKNLKVAMTGMTEKITVSESEQQQLESRLKISQFEKNQFFGIFNTFDFGVMLIDSSDTVFFINTYFLERLGRNHGDSIDTVFDNVIEHEGLNDFIRQHNRADENRYSRYMDLEFEDTHPGKSYRASSSDIADVEGTVFVQLIMVVDISKEKEVEKTQQDFINHIAHELRTPLTNIKAYNEMMMDGEISDLEMQKEFFNTINDETNRLAQLISSILELAETEIGQLTAKKEMVKTDWLMEGSLEAIEAVAREKTIAIERRVPDNFPKVSGDKEMLKSALINVLGNAVKYTPEYGTITFGVKETDQMVVFEINDTGFGIADKDLPHIFEKFFRSENDKVFDQSGTGLGLAITAEIIKIHDGVIEVQSELEKGSQFRIKIPKGDLRIG
jgi:two-component system phosphate regulon sensor histidine kinase PhoR